MERKKSPNKNGLKEWITNNNDLLSGLSSILTIIGFPTIIIAFILGYFQLNDTLSKAKLGLEFSNPIGLTFSVVNTSSKVAERPLYGFGIFDLDSDPVAPLPIPVREFSYLRGSSIQGPNALISQYGVDGHRYFGFAYVTCQNCDNDKWYWVYTVKGSPNKSWYYEMEDNEPKFWNPIQLMNNPELYIENHFPPNRRILIDK